MKTILYVLLALPLIYIGVLLCFYFLQDYLIFRNPKLHHTYEFKFPSSFEEIFVQNKSGVVFNCLLFKAVKSKGVIYYHHGNTGNLQYWGMNAETFVNLGYDVFMYDYRSYGKSGGKIKNEKQLHSDAALLFRYLNKHYSADRIIIYGISLGSGIAAKLAVKKPCKSLILETPYYNFHDTIKEHYPFLPVALISKYHFRTNAFIKKVNVPIYLFHGTKDEVVTYQSSLKLKELNQNIHLITLDGGSHSGLKDYPEYINAMKDVLN